MDLCRNRRDCFLLIRANSSLTTISAWMAYSRWTPIVVKQCAILVCPCPYLWNQWVEYHHIWGHKTLVKKVCHCQSLPSNFVLLGASYSVYWWVQSLQDTQDGAKFIWSHRCSILICHPFDCCKRGYVVLGLSNSSWVCLGKQDTNICNFKNHRRPYNIYFYIFLTTMGRSPDRYTQHSYSLKEKWLISSSSLFSLILETPALDVCAVYWFSRLAFLTVTHILPLSRVAFLP